MGERTERPEPGQDLGAQQPTRARLNTRRQEVLYYLSVGLRNSEIGVALGISERTVKEYVTQLLVAFGAANRTELVGKLVPGAGDPSRRMEEIRRLGRG